ncbi:MAG: carboxymuconolactone decarboxylase family protein [Deltaproteobacteria bacterium]|nr:carboxymuconolactone decarboxylase family protein [Deltaproteobacteria bacterium]
MADFYSHEVIKKRQRMRELKPELAKAFAEFSQLVFKDAALSSKVKNLIAVAVAHSTQCPWCIDGHTRRAKELGATDEEIAEAIFVAMEMRAGGAYTHSAIAMTSAETAKG